MISDIYRVAKKDVLQSRWIIVLLLVVLAAQTATSSPASENDISSFALQFLAFVVLILIAASFILNDSPSQPDAFWRVAPISARTIACAKLAGFAFVVLPSLVIANLLALHFNHVSIDEALPFTLKSTQLIFLLAPMMILPAAVTPNFKSFLIAAFSLLAFSTLLGNFGSFPSANREAAGIPWLHATLLLNSAAICVALYFIYTRKWTADQSRVVAFAVLVVIPLLHQLFVAGAIEVLHRMDRAKHLLPASNFSATIADSSVVIKFAAKSTHPRATFILEGAYGRINLNGRWYRLSGMETVASGYEDSLRKSPANPYAYESLIQHNSSSFQSIRVEGDSVRVELHLPFDESVKLLMGTTTSQVQFNGALFIQEPYTPINIAADTQFQSGHGSGTEVRVASVPDSGFRLLLSGRSLGERGNSVGEAFFGEGKIDWQGRPSTYPGRGRSSYDSVMLVSKSLTDTIRLGLLKSYEASSANIFLPIPFSMIHVVNVKLELDTAYRRVDLPELTKHARLIFNGWKYSSHAVLDASIPITRAQ